MNFDCFALNEQELRLMEKELEKKDVEASLRFLQEATDKSLEDLKEDLDKFLGDGEEKKEESKKDDINPFSALFSVFKKKEKRKKKNVSVIKDIKKDNWIEKEVRRLAANSARATIYKIYDVYKKAHGMASAPYDFDLGLQPTSAKVGFTDLFKG